MKPFLLIGNPDNRRVRDFCAALVAAGAPAPAVLSHAELLDDPGRLADLDEGPRWVRIDSLGESARVERSLLRLGFTGAPGDVDPAALDEGRPRHGEVLAPAQAQVGLRRYLDRLDEVFEVRPGWTLLSPTAAIRRLFDKRVVWREHRDAGLPVPEALDMAVGSPAELRAAMQARGWTRAFVKMSCGSSASGLAVFFLEPTERLMTSLVEREGGWFNRLAVRRVSGPEDIDRTLGFILAQGAHVEAFVPKARLDGAFFDLRVLVVDGEPAFTVVRQARHPITNLHLGGWRGDPDRLRGEVPADALEAMYATATAAARLHGCFQLGLDVMFTPGFREHRIIEANAFGDLLPGLERAGRSVYAHQIHRLSLR